MAVLRTQADIRASVDQAINELLDRAERGTQSAIQLAEKHAKRLAPVRKVSYVERDAATRDLTAQERRRLPTALRGIAGLKTATRRTQQYLPTPEVVEDRMTGKFQLADPSQMSFLSGRGLSELKDTHSSIDDEGHQSARSLSRRSGASAVYQTRLVQEIPIRRGGKIVGTQRRNTVRSTLGGRLRGEIRYRDASRGARIKFELVSPTPYAQYVEFPTSRTAAQPYMRPTLAYMEKHFPIHLKRAMRTGR